MSELPIMSAEDAINECIDHRDKIMRIAEKLQEQKNEYRIQVAFLKQTINELNEQVEYWKARANKGS